METSKHQRLLDAFEFIENFSNICNAHGLKAGDYSVKIDDDSCYASIFGLDVEVTKHYFFNLFQRPDAEFSQWCEARLQVAKGIKSERQNRIDTLKAELAKLEGQVAITVSQEA